MGRISGAFILFVLFRLTTFGQLMHEIPVDADYIEVDYLENVYAVKGSEIIQYGKNGDILFRYSNKLNGVVSCLDVTNPLRIILFYKESNTLAFLNRQLSLISDPVDLFGSANLEASVAGASANGFWVYSPAGQSLILFNSKLEKIQESQYLGAFVRGESIGFVQEQNQKIYLGLSEKVVVLDLFGTYLTTLHFEGAQFLKMVGGQLSYVKNDRLWVYDPVSHAEVDCTLPEALEIKSVFSYKKQLFVVSPGYISWYKMQY